uniref:Transposase Tc1-like domain-containing protein n=1 Tax=Acanthochromis polyacanthus TaxID=80966 RepID=A0A3Q1GBC6_9TELE
MGDSKTDRAEEQERGRDGDKGIWDARWERQGMRRDGRPGVVKYALDSNTSRFEVLETEGRPVDLQAEMNASRSESEKVSRVTTNRQLKEQGFKGRKAARKTLLRPRTKKVFWIDASKSELFGQHHHIYVCRKAREHFDARCITVKHGGDSITVWGSICVNDIDKLVEIDSIMNKKPITTSWCITESLLDWT